MKRERKILYAQLAIVAAVMLVLLAGQVFFSGSEAPEEEAVYAAIDDFNGVSLVVMPDTEYEDVAKVRYPNSKRVYVTEWADMAMRVASGKEEGFFCEDDAMEDVFAEFSNLYALPEIVTQTQYHFVTSKTEKGTKLINEFNSFLKDFRQSGSFDLMMTKWFEAAEPQALLPAEYAENAPILHIATYSDWRPYTFLEDRQLTGFYVDLIRQFCVKAGYSAQFTNVDPTSALIGVGMGKYDIDIYGCVYSEERAQKVNFSDPMEGTDLYLVTRASRVIGADVGEIKEESFFEGVVDSFRRSYLEENRWQMLLSGLGVTLLLVLCSIIAGTLLGAFIFYLHRCKNVFMTGFARMYIKFFQGLPDVLLLLVLFYVIFRQSSISGVGVCIIGFSLAFSAYVAEMIRAGVEAIPEGQLRAALALGYGKTHAFWKVVFPQAVWRILPVYKGEVISLVKNTSIAGYIAVEDMTKVSDLIRAQTYEAIFPLIVTAVIYFLLSSVLVSLLKTVEVNLDPQTRRRLPKGL